MKIIFLCFTILLSSTRNENTLDLFSKAAVLIDGESGRILYGKNEKEILPNASTTKILTCIVALENAGFDEVVTVSDYAASMPDVQLNIKSGERYYLKDLLYSLMLESHNDSAVAIAEHVAGSVENFSQMLNKKAKELGCYDTHFVTPNGLDASDENGKHSTTAYDLALLMKYCIQNKDFLEITQTMSYNFKDLDNKRNFQVNNKNAFLNVYVGMISGKTGFTSDAGYCYVGACDKNHKKLIIALLGCGWPPHKTRKWTDARKLLDYGNTEYEKYAIDSDKKSGKIKIKVAKGVRSETYLEPEIRTNKYVLLRKGEKINSEYDYPDEICAPVKNGSIVGSVKYKIDGEIIYSVPIVTRENVDEKIYGWNIGKLINLFFLN